ncbi:four-carbon acid sugar kinase family protein [Pullulanibacillus sp. KACC 23026]|uniref:four-carbon acid sugar kinase family protein n=1 Tax=Pullulanibacillus sp. KACC 23026 TaxID=3028315 RepID=UPI0023AEB6FD|nr:four-carbon acid sugar kinase family protein [Pullulanibacillus sp. KACC 23026]WEG11724.1 four-carbon acid sugar kinase family protein [Pullulanibacillus sp. KACC 23026]
MNQKLIGFYGDDFTGSTDAMEALTLSGIRTVLFLKAPSENLLNEQFPDIEAFGIAGVSRSLDGQQMEEELREAFESLKQSKARVCHYKTCSTLDSSPQIGSIGKAIELAVEVFDINQSFIPLVVGVPRLKRFTVFGHHFATLEEETYRLDRHPIMSQHPTTPMDESDLRIHLSKQTHLPIDLLNVLELEQPTNRVKEIIDSKVKTPNQILLFDVLSSNHLEKAGELIWEESENDPFFAVGSSGIEYALTKTLETIGAFKKPHFPPLPSEGPVLVVSGSCSSMTQKQIKSALDYGLIGLKVSGEQLLLSKNRKNYCEQLVQEAIQLLAKGKSVLMYSAFGDNDPDILTTKKGLEANGMDPKETGHLFGEQLGKMSQEIIRKQKIKRVIIAGGDTSGYVLKELDIYAMEMISPVSPGAPLCKAYSYDPNFDDLQICLKGGQMGERDFFIQVSGLIEDHGY